MNSPVQTEQRAIDHLLGQPVLVEAYLDTWRPDPDWKDVALVLKYVKLTDYETGKTSLAKTLDHCWLWIPENCWKTRYNTAIATNAQMLLNDKVWLCCTVSKYIRSNGTIDYGLKPRNEFPVSLEQARVIRQANQKLRKHAKHLYGEDLAVKFTSQCLLRTQLDMKAADWREIGYSWKDAKANVELNISALSAAMEIAPGVTEAMMEQVYHEGSYVVEQTKIRIEAAG
ncbi:hypothetical protein H6F88_17925 [Oculatella sp. FACHB-28]|uniref:hypothetical protein n=1 Tax=Oculatella sp. FACHB-28 TaxID=2692845 RepID=UPI001686D204|nr:hypothetical protein [Oculatella sp. FACHB-28]MBD2057875.1 hypothetical protein [Oculatella sp. FACHB-28]